MALVFSISRIPARSITCCSDKYFMSDFLLGMSLSHGKAAES